MNWQDYIHRDPAVMSGKPVIKGTRLTVEHILERLSDGWDPQSLLSSYPQLRQEHIHAALRYAAASLASDEVVFLGQPS